MQRDAVAQSSEHVSRDAVETILTFRIKTYRFGIRLAVVEKVVHVSAISALPGAPDVVAGVINLHGAVVPVLDMQLRLGGRTAQPGLDAQLLIIDTPVRRLAILADEVLDIAAIPANEIIALEALAPGVGILSGVAAAPDGLVYIQDANALLMHTEEIHLASALQRTAG